MPKTKPSQRSHGHALGGKGRGGPYASRRAAGAAAAAGSGPGVKGKGQIKKMKSFSRLSTTTTSTPTAAAGPARQEQMQGKKKSHHQQQQHNRPIVPFGRRDRILLVGEGDFSFARSLVVHHKCKNVMATCYDSQEVLVGKYPQAKQHIEDILAAAAVNARNGNDGGAKAHRTENGGSISKNEAVSTSTTLGIVERRGPKVLYGVDARKLGLGAAGGGKELRNGFTRRERTGGKRVPAWRIAKEVAKTPSSRSGGHTSIAGAGAPKIGLQGQGQGQWDIICFNFPHVGGLSTDVNRQVRANQELLVAFFKACVPLLSSPLPAKTLDDDDDDDEEEDFNTEDEWDSDLDSNRSEDDDEDDDDTKGEQTPSNISKNKPRTEPGQILVTLFEGEPYTLWNIRDLARHSELRVVTSFKFPWTSYPGYSHARTLGEVESKHGGGGRGGWRGEDREARMYVFELKQEQNASKNGNGAGKRKKTRARDDDDSDTGNSD